jgi:hypothetical protein
LKTCGKLLPTTSQKRRKLVEKVFRECCNDGLHVVDNSILSNFLIAAPNELSKQILEDALLENPRAENLPKFLSIEGGEMTVASIFHHVMPTVLQ